MDNTIEFIGALLGTVNWQGWLLSPMAELSDASNLFFFNEINQFLKEEIDEFGIRLLGRTMSWMGGIVLSLMTLWIMIQGYRIATGQSRDSMMALVTNSLRAVLIIGVATGMALGGSQIYGAVTDGLNEAITQMVTGKDENAYDSIDRSLGYMQLAMSSIDALQVGGSDIVNEAKTRNMWFTGIGTGGPAITAGTMLLLNKIAMALFVGLGPLFILCLLFEQTKQLFSRWLFYGIGTMFSLAVLSVMVALALDMVVAVAGSFWVGKFLGASQEGISSMALQQGGLGLILTMLLISAPPMAASFFQGVLANFTPYTALGGDSGLAAAKAATRGQQAPSPYYPPEQRPVHNAPPGTMRQDVSDKRPPFDTAYNPGTRTTSPSYVQSQERIRTSTNTQQGVAGTQQQATHQLPPALATGKRQ
jgi:type IV secretion system protein VirB6